MGNAAGRGQTQVTWEWQRRRIDEGAPFEDKMAGVEGAAVPDAKESYDARQDPCIPLAEALGHVLLPCEGMPRCAAAGCRHRHRCLLLAACCLLLLLLLLLLPLTYNVLRRV